LNTAGAWLWRGKSRISRNDGRGSNPIPARAERRQSVCRLRSAEFEVTYLFVDGIAERLHPCQLCEAVPVG